MQSVNLPTQKFQSLPREEEHFVRNLANLNNSSNAYFQNTKILNKTYDDGTNVQCTAQSEEVHHYTNQWNTHASNYFPAQ